MLVKGVVDRIEDEQIVVLLSEEAVVLHWPRCFLPHVQENDILSFNVKVEVPAKEARKINAKSLLESLAWHPDQ